MTEKSYEDGIVEGKIQALEAIAATHDKRLNSHSSRLRYVERAVWLMLGAYLLVQFLPTLRAFFSAVAP